MLSNYSRKVWLILVLLAAFPGAAYSELDYAQLRLFGYFQTSYTTAKDQDSEDTDKSFSMQQLNMFLQRDLSNRVTAFANFEFLNNYSSSHQWGSLAVEEAWVKWHLNPRFNLRVGLQTPTFNYLNDIKNRTPLLAYVIRPLVYESSFNEIIRTEEYLPARAYVQVYGYFPAPNSKIEYAAYLGNSPNINSDPENGQTGVDTTSSYLVGGRLGLRSGEFNLGFSATYDKYNFSKEVGTLVDDQSLFASVPRVRVGGDFRYAIGKFAVESEFIRVNYDEKDSDFSVDMRFYYGTLYFEPVPKLKVYGTYWYVKEKFFGVEEEIGFGGVFKSFFDVDYFFTAIGGGVSYNFSDDVVIKLQAAPVHQEIEEPDRKVESDFNYLALGLSVML